MKQSRHSLSKNIATFLISFLGLTSIVVGLTLSASILCVANIVTHNNGIGNRQDQQAAKRNTAEQIAKTAVKEEQPTSPKTNIKFGDIGRIEIAELGYSAALYYCENDLPKAQEIVDMEDAACWWILKKGATPFICDHSEQGLSVINEAIPGTTTVSIKHDNGECETYLCTARFQGHNGETITDEDGNDLTFANQNGICIYTCNDNWQNITITNWMLL